MNKNPNENKDNVVPNPNGEDQNTTPKQESFMKRWIRRTWRYGVVAVTAAAGGFAFATVVNARKAEAGNETETEEETDETENSEEEITPEF